MRKPGHNHFGAARSLIPATSPQGTGIALVKSPLPCPPGFLTCCFIRNTCSSSAANSLSWTSCEGKRHIHLWSHTQTAVKIHAERTILGSGLHVGLGRVPTGTEKLFL